ncbi:MAG TPA: hypothetical protein VFU09_06755 [Candidatus Udaeobacter sp.]|nr:hypothetical protein [Candidatus Udaeobacter sp.]
MSRTTEAVMRHMVPPPVGRAILAKKTFVRPNQPNEKKNVLLENAVIETQLTGDAENEIHERCSR